MKLEQLDEEMIFDLARKIESAEIRAEYVRQVCGNNATLFARVQALLEVHDKQPEFLEAAPSGVAPATDLPSIAERPGAAIGDYKLLDQIGEGGMGVVYAAQQQRPVRRNVALKIIKPGMDTKEVIARFEAERQALALMNHPHIAKVLDAGSTESGRPYFAMELVRGIPITDYCDRYKFTTRQRLELFASACQAVQHAHQKGVIHRDIKPSNVLVTQHDGVALPKIIDFGIAKAIDQRLTEKTLSTEYGRMVGTPLYMSPEQAGMGGHDVDTRTDIYSLGVLLYELLTGATPFERKKLEKLTYDEIRRIIRDEEPLKPSTKISDLGATATSVSASRRTDPKRLSALLRRDLDWIVMKALDKDRDRRYETADRFAMDVRRYLNEEPVEAFPPSAAYKFFKFARRNKRSLLTAAALLALLVAGTLVSVCQAIRARDSERMAKAEAAASEAVIAFINRDLFAQADPSQEPDRDLKVRVALDRASSKIAGRFVQQPLVEAAIRHAVGTSYLSLGEYSKSEQHLQKAVKIRRRHLGAEHRKTMASMMHLAIAICDQGRHQEAEKLHEKVLTIQQRTLGEEHPYTLICMMNLAAAIYQQGRYKEVEKITLKLLDIQRRALGQEHSHTLKSMINLASVKRVQGQHSQAEKLCRKVLLIQRRTLRAEHPQTIDTISVLANAVLAQGRYVEAERLHQEVYDVRRRVFGPEHPLTLSSMNNLSLVIFKRGRYDKAEELRRQLLEIQQRTLGVEHPSTLQTKLNLANVFNARGDFVEAEKLHQEVFDTRRQILGEEHPDTLKSKFNLSNAISAQGRHAEAEQSYCELLGVQIRVSGPQHPSTLKTRMNLSVTIHKQRRFAEAEKLRREILRDQISILGPEHPDTLVSMLNLANTIHAQGRHQEAKQRYRDVLDKMRQTLGEEHPHTLNSMMALARALKAEERYVQAIQGYRQVLELQRRVLGPKHPQTLHSMNALVWLLSFSAPPDQRNPAQAVEIAKEALRHEPHNARRHQTLGQAQYRAGQLPEAIQSLRKSIQIRGPNQHDILTLALIHWRLGQQDCAIALYEWICGRTLKSKCYIRLRAELESLMGSSAMTETPKGRALTA